MTQRASEILHASSIAGQPADSLNQLYAEGFRIGQLMVLYGTKALNMRATGRGKPEYEQGLRDGIRVECAHEGKPYQAQLVS